MSSRHAQPLPCYRAGIPAGRAAGFPKYRGRASTMARLALAVAASVAWLFTPGALSGQARDTATAKVRPRPGSESATAPACCLVVRLDRSSVIVTARETATGYTFRFRLENRRRRAALEIGDPVWADFGTNTVKLVPTDAKPCCVIVTTPPSSARDSSGTGGASRATRIPDPRI